MKSKIFCNSYLLCMLLLLAGCSLPWLKGPVNTEAELFALALDQYISSGDLTTLNQLQQKYPKGKLWRKAEKIIKMTDEPRELKAQLTRMNNELTLCREKKELSNCQQEKEALTQDTKMLEKTLKQLKEVLIDAEKHTE